MRKPAPDEATHGGLSSTDKGGVGDGGGLDGQDKRNRRRSVSGARRHSEGLRGRGVWPASLCDKRT